MKWSSEEQHLLTDAAIVLGRIAHRADYRERCEAAADSIMRHCWPHEPGETMDEDQYAERERQMREEIERGE